MEILTPDHDRWAEFADRLHGPDACNFQQEDPDDPASIKWTCDSDLGFSEYILEQMGFDVVGTVAYFKENGGHCDCEVLFNVNRDA